MKRHKTCLVLWLSLNSIAYAMNLNQQILTLGQQALTTFAHEASYNPQLIRPLAQEWLLQHPNDNYADLVNLYKRTLPVCLMRSMWHEARVLQFYRHYPKHLEFGMYLAFLGAITRAQPLLVPTSHP